MGTPLRVPPSARPILFTGEMVRAIRAGRKTQTRRVIIPQPFSGGLLTIDAAAPSGFAITSDADGDQLLKCPYGRPGDRLYVRETWTVGEDDDGPFLYYNADNEQRWYQMELAAGHASAWLEHAEECCLGRMCALKPSIHMPRWASRLTLQVEKIRVEKIQDITEADAIAEGGVTKIDSQPWGWDADLPAGVDQSPYATARAAFRDRWDHLNGKRGYGWKQNPWIWVIEFKSLTTGETPP